MKHSHQSCILIRKHDYKSFILNTPQAYSRFLIDIIDSAGPDDANMILQRLLSGPEKLDFGIIDELRRRIVFNHKKLKPPVRYMRSYLRRMYRSFPVKDTVILLLGSGEFNDPFNLDGDIMLVAPEHGDVDVLQKITQQNRIFLERINRNWHSIQLQPNSPAQAFVVHDNDIRMFISTIPSYGGEYAEFAALSISAMLTGMPLFKSQQPIVDTIRTRAADMIQREPLLTILVNNVLENSLEIRRERERLNP